jgi:hypothetical protein
MRSFKRCRTKTGADFSLNAASIPSSESSSPLVSVYHLYFMQWLSLALSYSMRGTSGLHEVAARELHRLIHHRLPKTATQSASHGDTLRDLYDRARTLGMVPKYPLFNDLQCRKRWSE